ncbi:MAG: class I SAM-dependent methyltransferase, partial [Bacteroidota bacterium]|nr:class I SAM-dependent methyltransferase [Bacteroidota bacterium]
QVEFRHGTQAALDPGECFDAIVTFFVLDCIELAEMPAALDQLDRALAPAGRWLLADFRYASGGWRRALHRAMFGFFRLTTGLRADFIPDFAADLHTRGLRAERGGRFYAEAMEALIFWRPAQ